MFAAHFKLTAQPFTEHAPVAALAGVTDAAFCSSAGCAAGASLFTSSILRAILGSDAMACFICAWSAASFFTAGGVIKSSMHTPIIAVRLPLRCSAWAFGVNPVSASACCIFMRSTISSRVGNL